MFTTLLVQPIFNLLAFIYAVAPGHDFGIAVIVLTVLVRLALWPLVAKQLHSQKALQDLAPEVSRVRKKAKGDKQLESKLLMELYKEREINPFASLLPLLIQLPLFLALFVVLRDMLKSGEVAKLIYSSLRDLGPIKAIIAHPGDFKPTLFGLFDLAKPSWILALAAGAAQYFQTSQLMPKNPDADPQAKALANSSKLFPILTVIIGLRLPGALALYWTFASLVAIFQQHLLLNRDVEDLEKGKS